MADVVTTVAETGTQFAGKTGILLIGAVGIIVFAILIYWLRSGAREDRNLERKEHWIEEAKKNMNPDMEGLYLTHTPSFKSYMRRMTATLNRLNEKDKADSATATRLADLIKETRMLYERVAERRSTVYYGPITGWLVTDMLTNARDFYMEHKKSIGPKQYEKLKEVIEETGGTIHIFVYKTKGGILGIGTNEEVIIAPDEQVTGIGSTDGVVVLHGLGTQRIGKHFSLLTGLPEFIDLFRTHLVSLSRIDLALEHEGSIGEITRAAMESDAPNQKAVEMIRATQPSIARGSEE